MFSLVHSRFAQYILLAFALFSLSQSGNLIRFCDAHPIVIAFYRSLFTFVAIFPFFLRDLRAFIPNFKDPQFARSSRRAFLTMIVMGVIFSVHFISWIFAVQKTSISSAVICYSLAPLYTAILSIIFLREKIHHSLFVTMFLGFAGIYLIGLHDFKLESNYILGDFLATFSAFLFGIYLLLGNHLRKNSKQNSFMILMGTIYGVVSLVCFLLIIILDIHFFPLNQATWLALATLAIFTTMLGHGSLIYLLKFFRPSFISVLTLFEPLGAMLVAYFLWGENITLAAIAGYLLITVGLIYLIKTNPKEH